MPEALWYGICPAPPPAKLVAVVALVAEVAEVALVAVEAFPFKVAVIVLAEKLPEASRATIVLAPFVLEAVVAELATLNVPPNVKEPLVVTVPLSVNPDTVPVPLTDVTEPVGVVAQVWSPRR